MGEPAPVVLAVAHAICDGVDWRDAVRSLACCALRNGVAALCNQLHHSGVGVAFHPPARLRAGHGHRPGFQGEDFDGDIRSGDSAGFGEAVVGLRDVHDCRGDVVGAGPAN